MIDWLFIVIFILCASYCLNFIVSILNLTRLSDDLPAEFNDILSPQEYLRSLRYTRATTLFSLAESTYTLLLIIVFISFKGFLHLDSFARYSFENEMLRGLIFFGSCLSLSFLAQLPFSIFFTFNIEEKFGFNRTTVGTFITDILKSALLITIIGGPLLISIFWFFNRTGPYGWFFCWIGFVVFFFVLQYLAPILILPLFNKFKPLPDGDLREKILEYARQQNFFVEGIFTMDGSKRSGKLNAFFIGFGRHKKIVFFDTLLEKLEEQEVLAVLAHEMGHYKLHHVPKMIFATIGQLGMIFYIMSIFLKTPTIAEAFGINPSIYASLLLFAFLYTPINAIVSILFNTFSRKHEFEADRFALTTTGSAETLISSLKKLAKANLANLTPHPLYVFMYYSHPPLLTRIKQLRMLAGSA